MGSLIKLGRDYFNGSGNYNFWEKNLYPQIISHNQITQIYVKIRCTTETTK